MKASTAGTLERIADLHRCGVTPDVIAKYFGTAEQTIVAVIAWLT